MTCAEHVPIYEGYESFALDFVLNPLELSSHTPYKLMLPRLSWRGS